MLPGEQEIQDALPPWAGAYHWINIQHKELSACQCSMGVALGGGTTLVVTSKTNRQHVK